MQIGIWRYRYVQFPPYSTRCDRLVLSHSASRPKLTDRDTIILADFENKTGDPVFDDTLRQGLSVISVWQPLQYHSCV